MSGIKITAGVAVIGIVVGEFVATDRGLGKIVIESRRSHGYFADHCGDICHRLHRSSLARYPRIRGKAPRVLAGRSMSLPSAAELKSAVTLNWPAILLGIVVLLLWEGFTRGLDLSKNLFPPPSLVLWSLYVRARPAARSCLADVFADRAGFCHLGRGRHRARLDDLQVTVAVRGDLPRDRRAPGRAERGARSAAGALVRRRHLVTNDPRLPDRLLPDGHQHDFGREGAATPHARLRELAFDAVHGNSSPRSSCPRRCPQSLPA